MPCWFAVVESRHELRNPGSDGWAATIASRYLRYRRQRDLLGWAIFVGRKQR